jgi:hypothetical protein
MCKFPFKPWWFLEVYTDHVAQVVPDIAALPFANVSVMTWVVGSAGQRQVVSSGDNSCVPIDEWLVVSYGFVQHSFSDNSCNLLTDFPSQQIGWWY